jgi:hypothetical protein
MWLRYFQASFYRPLHGERRQDLSMIWLLQCKVCQADRLLGSDFGCKPLPLLAHAWCWLRSNNYLLTGTE